MRSICVHTYDSIISLENLLLAWKEFVIGKRNRQDVLIFERNLMDNIIALHRDLAAKTYCHSGYEAFRISDPKPRHIHKASVRDRVVHRAVYRILFPFFDRLFIADSFSCRDGKGVHKALDRFRVFVRKVSHNHTRTVWVLKCDVRKFFASIDHDILLRILREHIPDRDILGLLVEIVGSFHTEPGKGLPLGNLTSQLLSNVYLNEFDRFVKHTIRARYYIRYADDFVILSHDKDELESMLPRIREFLNSRLALTLHPDKVSIAAVVSGVDFLGWVHFPNHRVLRTATRRRMFRNLEAKDGKPETVQSYLGLLRYGNTYGIRRRVGDLYGIETG
ncbi:MAG: hypothetical protein HGA31_06765 [Candidatus Moranbacteria bacterium]|nr:hypothetical protein [Candidatus Moranbacteria bacterium]